MSSVEVSERDYVMARLAAARASASAAVLAIDDALALFVDPDEDDDGSERMELIESALEGVGIAARALEAAEEEMPNVDPEECEPWEDEDEDDEDDDEEPEPPRVTARKKKK